MAKARVEDWKNPEYGPVVRERIARIERLRDQELWGAAWEYYANWRVADWIEDWLVTYDPRAVNRGESPWKPLILFPKQAQYVAWLTDRFIKQEDGAVAKSRDVGMSWLCCAFALYLWSFHPGSNIGFGSQKLEKVDQLGNPKSLFEKIRMMLRNLPKELRPVGYQEAKHAKSMRIINPENGAVINGEGGDNIGRGDRSSIYFIDEAAFIERPDAVDSALSATTDCRIDVSTPNRPGDAFHQKVVGETCPIFFFHWNDDPRKDADWYEKQRIKFRHSPEILAREVDLDFEASASDTVILTRWVQASKRLRELFEKDGKLPELGDGIGGLDIGGGKAASVFVPRWGPVVGSSVAWTEEDSIDTAGKARVLAGRHKCSEIKFDVIGVGKGVASAFKRLKDVVANGVNVGNKPTSTVWPDKKRSRDKFTNLKAELWWMVQDRLRRTWEHWLYVEGKGGEKQDLKDLLLLPDDPDLCHQLTLPRYSHTESGKIQIERKSQMASRGVSSPDYADALVLTFAPSPARMKSGRATGWY